MSRPTWSPRSSTSATTPTAASATAPGDSDLYYTVFGLEGLVALRRRPVPRDRARLPRRLRRRRHARLRPSQPASRAAGRTCPRSVPRRAPPAHGRRASPSFARPTAATTPRRGEAIGTAYGASSPSAPTRICARRVPDPDAPRAFDPCRCTAADGGLSNFPDAPVGPHARDAGGIALLRQLDAAGAGRVGEWLLQRAHPAGRLLRPARRADARPALDGDGAPRARRPARRPRAGRRSRASTSSTRCGPTRAASTGTGPTTCSTASTPTTRLLALGPSEPLTVHVIDRGPTATPHATAAHARDGCSRRRTPPATGKAGCQQRAVDGDRGRWRSRGAATPAARRKSSADDVAALVRRGVEWLIADAERRRRLGRHDRERQQHQHDRAVLGGARHVPSPSRPCAAARSRAERGWQSARAGWHRAQLARAIAGALRQGPHVLGADPDRARPRRAARPRRLAASCRSCRSSWPRVRTSGSARCACRW